MASKFFLNKKKKVWASLQATIPFLFVYTLKSHKNVIHILTHYKQVTVVVEARVALDWMTDFSWQRIHFLWNIADTFLINNLLPISWTQWQYVTVISLSMSQFYSRKSFRYTSKDSILLQYLPLLPSLLIKHNCNIQEGKCASAFSPMALYVNVSMFSSHIHVQSRAKTKLSII